MKIDWTKPLEVKRCGEWLSGTLMPCNYTITGKTYKVVHSVYNGDSFFTVVDDNGRASFLNSSIQIVRNGPITVERWLIVFKDGTVFSYPTEAEARRFAKDYARADNPTQVTSISVTF